MKFTWKVFFCTIVVIAAALGFAGFYIIHYTFNAALGRETEQALDECRILSFAFETAALNVPVRYESLPDKTIEQIGTQLGINNLIRISNEQGYPLFVSGGFISEDIPVLETDERSVKYKITQYENRYYVQTSAILNVVDRALYIETWKDVTSAFEEQKTSFSAYRRITALTLSVGSLTMLGLSIWLTRPVRLLSQTTRKMAAGEYHLRTKVVSRDELGRLTMDFNQMAASLEDKIYELEDEASAREDFVAAFAHELKTPLTAIIGYADLLRVREMDADKQFTAADYIYREGKRLESLSFRLLDIIVLRRRDLYLQMVPVDSIFDYLSDTFTPIPDQPQDITLQIDFEPGEVYAETSLIRTVMDNLIDNARKASEPGGIVEVRGCNDKDGYRFSVRDYGCGIPREEIHKITEAFYRVDKSRARSRSGSGLGLALCAEIIALHGNRLRITSQVGKGTKVFFVLSARGEDQ